MRRKAPPPPPIEIRQFTPDEAEGSIAKLERLIQQVEALKVLRHDDQRVYNAGAKISDTVLEIFGANSAEFDRYQHYRIQKKLVIASSEYEDRQWFMEGIEGPLLMLQGLMETIQERVADLERDRSARYRSAFNGLSLHPRIAEASVSLFSDRHYRNAVLDAALALEQFVKDKSGRRDLDGADLMRKVFSKNSPILAFNDLSDQNGLNEQEGLMHIFEGVMLALRNPRAHSLVATELNVNSPGTRKQQLGYLPTAASGFGSCFSHDRI
jgi:uncharacterized protein (TIGR02391 family)